VRKRRAKPAAGRSLKPVEKFDIALAQALSLEEDSLAGRWVGRFAELGDQPPMQALSGVTIAAGAIRRDRRMLRAGLRMLAAHSFATLAKAFVKDSVDRTRPGDAIDKHRYRMATGDSDAHRLQSMPSGHSAGVTAVAASGLTDYPQAAGPVLAGSVALAAAQLPSRNHYLSDVAIGSVIGLGAFTVARLILPPLESPKRRAERNSRTPNEFSKGS
jgi:undecaprenyl-diphosphatase